MTLEFDWGLAWYEEEEMTKEKSETLRKGVVDLYATIHRAAAYCGNSELAQQAQQCATKAATETNSKTEAEVDEFFRKVFGV